MAPTTAGAPDRAVAAAGLESDERDDADEPEHDPDQAETGGALGRVDPEREDGDEDRSGGVEDRSETRVDVLLAPGDQEERERGVERAHERERDR